MSKKISYHGFSAAVVLIGLVVSTIGQVAGTAVASSTPEFTQVRRDTFEKVWNTINEKHYDPTFNGVDWSKVRDEYLPKAQAAKSDEDFHNVLRRMLAELKLSHFNIFPPPPSIGEPESNGSVGIDVIWLEGVPVIERIEKDSSAERALLKPGFVIKSIDGKPVAELLKPIIDSLEKRTMSDGMRRLYLERTIEAMLAGKAGTTASVEFLDGKNALLKAELARVAYTGEMSQPVGNFPKQEVHFESRLLPGNIGYIRFNMWVIPQAAKIRAAIREFANADGIIFDIRRNPGGIGGLAGGVAGQISDKQFSLGTMSSRSGVMTLVGYPQPDPYLGKIAVLTDHGSASTSEMFAAGIQESGRGKIVGETSAGAILLSVFDKLPSGWMFQYAISDYKSPQNILIEGRGVVPDIKVAVTRASLLEGRDLQLEAAVRSISSNNK